ncbi:class I SAM-dependent methyltransferase [Sedimentitalea sp. JM2-8]|uniref:Class I SAM-dependent methyltransferase n=1 Tax=Sedimentitalea xiamensis TaxID=3050037 RepID=A0ABT7FG20_9RHOB|nr:class I SAM-dependent methyltransferase [Sedimentitalea xiamensis]MDK3074062.1 class I SAM-dependent methyltransferase [Sedimentitalea xiamensis]
MTPPTDPATERLNAALAELDATMAEVDELQRKVDHVTSRMDTLLHRTVRSPTANLGANLRSLDARSDVLRKALDRARRAYAAARKGYHQASRAYREHHDQVSVRQAAIGTGLADAERCKAALERCLTDLLGRQADPGETQAQRLDGANRYLPVPISRFFDSLIALERHLALDPDYDHPALRHRPVSFLDVGCGSGRDLALARSSGILPFSAIAGFDADEMQIARGRTLFGLGGDIRVADALSFDYGGFDVVFSVRPFPDPERLAAFESRLVSTLSPSAYLIAVLPLDLARFPDLDAIDPAHGIWKKTAPTRGDAS